MVICKENKICVVDNLLLVSKKHSDHLYWHLITKIKFPSSIMITGYQKNFNHL